MEDVLVPAIIFLSIAAIVKIISDNRTKRKLIDGGVSEEFARTIFAGQQDPTAWAALKWGLVVMGLGVALVIVQFLPYDFEEPIAYGLMFLLAGAGLLIYYAIARQRERRKGYYAFAQQRERRRNDSSQDAPVSEEKSVA